MKSNTTLLRCLALGIGVLVIFLWWRSRHADVEPAAAALVAIAAKPATTPDQRAAVPTPTTSSSEKESAADAARLLREETHAMIRAKLRRWFATKTGDTDTQEAITQELLSLLTDANTAEIIRSLSPEEFNTPFGTGALEHWLKLDSIQAARWIATRPDANEQHALIVARQMLQAPAQSPALIAQLPDNAWKQSVLNSASLEAIAKNPATAIAFAQQMAPGDAQTNALETIAYDWFGRDLGAATTWAQTLQDPKLRERLLAVGAKAIANADPDLAAGWLVSSVKTEGVLNETALSIVETWTDRHPTEAANWVARFSEAGPRKTAIDLVLGHWLKSDPVAANAWIQTLPEREAIRAKLQADQADRDRAPAPE